MTSTTSVTTTEFSTGTVDVSTAGLTVRTAENPAEPVHADEIAGADRDLTVQVNLSTALGYPPVFRGVGLIAGDLGRAPLEIFRREAPVGTVEDVWRKDRAHQAWRLCRWEPNDCMGASTFRKTITAHAILEGNGFAYIDRDPNNRPLELWPLNPKNTRPVRLDGQLFYHHVVRTGVGDDPEKIIRQTLIEADDVLHIKGFTWNGVEGVSLLTIMRETFGLGLNARRFATKFFANDARPSVVMEHPGKLSQEAHDRIRAGWQSMHRGVNNSHRLAILEEGMTLKPFSTAAKDAQLDVIRAFQTREVAAVLGIPPHKLGDTTRTSFASLEQENQSYVQETLEPWFVAWEEESRRKLLRIEERRRETHEPRFNRASFSFTDLATRTNSANAAIQLGWMNRDEARETIGRNPIPDGQGQAFYQPLNVGIAGQVDSNSGGDGEGGGGQGTGEGDETPGDELLDELAPTLRQVLTDTIAGQLTRLAARTKAAARRGSVRAWFETGAFVNENRGRLVDVLTNAHRGIEIAGLARSNLAEAVDQVLDTWRSFCVKQPKADHVLANGQELEELAAQLTRELAK